MLWDDSGCEIPPTMIHWTTSKEVKMDVNNLLKFVVVFALLSFSLPLMLMHYQQLGMVVAIVVPERVAPSDLYHWYSVDESDTTAVFGFITTTTDIVFAATVFLVSFFHPQMTPSKNDMLLLPEEL